MEQRSELVCRSHDDNGNVNPKWLNERKLGVTATDIAKLLSGGSAMKLWARKTGRMEDDDLSQVEFVQWGHVMESVVLEQYSTDRYAGRKVVPSGELMRSIEHPFLLATLDARTEHPDYGWVPLDAKNVGSYREHRWEEGIPDYERWQIRHQAIVEDTGAASIAAVVGGNKLLWADEELEMLDAHKVLTTAEKFWWYCTNDIAPEEMDGTDDTKRALDATYNPGGDTIKLKPEYTELEIEWMDLKATLSTNTAADKVLRVRKLEIENKIKRAMGNHGKAMTTGGGIWTLTHFEESVRKPSVIKATNKLVRMKQK